MDYYYEVYKKGDSRKIAIGVILGKSVDKYSTLYSVHLFKNNISMIIDGNYLEWTGRIFKREDFYDGDTITLSTKGELVRINKI